MPRLRLEPEGGHVEVAAGTPLLEAAEEHGLPIPFGCVSARCGVCRVEVLAGGEAGLAAPSKLERVVLRGFDAPPAVRLACQAVVTGDVAVRSLHPPEENGPPGEPVGAGA